MSESGAAPIVNNNTAKKTAYELAELPLPNSTELIETVYKAGKLVGNGNVWLNIRQMLM